MLPNYDFHKNESGLSVKGVVCWRPFNHDIFAPKMAQFTVKKPISKDKYQTLVNIHTHTFASLGFFYNYFETGKILVILLIIHYYSPRNIQ